MGTPIDFDQIRVGDRIVVTQGSSLEESDTAEYSTHRYIGNVTKTFRSSDPLNSDYIQTESCHFSRGGSTSRFRTYELISRTTPVVKVGDVVRPRELETLPHMTVLAFVNDNSEGDVRVVDEHEKRLISSSLSSYPFSIYVDGGDRGAYSDLFRVKYIPEEI